MPPLIALVVGASSGIGRACAEQLHGLGLRVYGASRSIAEQPYETLRLDVDDDASVRAAVGEVIEREGRVDILVNCAGYVLAGAVEETSIDEARAQMETNFFGAVRTLQAVLPEMRRQRSGLIINIGSIAGLIPMPFQAFYSASKSALTTVSEALAMEVAGLGIRIINIQPGDFRTAITANRRRAKSMGLEEDYRLRGERAVSTMEKDEQSASGPDAIARRVGQLAVSRRRPSSILIGPFIQRLAVLLRVLLPRRVFDWGLGKYYGL